MAGYIGNAPVPQANLPLPTSCKKAKELGMSQYFTGKPCKHGHVSHRFVGSQMCSVCHNKISDTSRKNNWDNYLATSRKQKASRARYYENNKHKWAEHSANRRARKLAATFGNQELNELAMAEAHELAKERTEMTGVKHHVDHIVPLRGNTVCGFHSWNNIKVIPWYENLTKGNKIMENL